MTFKEFLEKMPELPDDPSLEQWQTALDQANELAKQVDEGERALAETAIGDTLIQAGAFLGFVLPE